jgi:hypothetical protein
VSGGAARRDASGFLVTLLAAATYSTVGATSKLAGQQGMGPIGYLEWRAVAAVIALGVMIAVGVRIGWVRLPSLDAIPGRERRALILAGIAHMVITVAMIVAFSRMSIAVAMIVFYAAPAIVTIISFVRHGERPSRVRVGSLVLSFAGLLLVVVAPMAGTGAIAIDPLGLALAAFAAVLQAIYMLVAARGYPSVPAIGAVFVLLAVAIPGNLVAAALFGALPEVAAPFGDPSLLVWAILGGVLGAAIPTTSLQHGMRLLGAGGAAILMMIEPFFAATYAFILLGEVLGPIQVLGGAMVIAAGMLLQVGDRGAGSRPRGATPSVAAGGA